MARRRRRLTSSDDDGAEHLALARIVVRATGVVTADDAERMDVRELRALAGIDRRAARVVRTALDRAEALAVSRARQ